MELKHKAFGKTYEVSRSGVIVVYPSLQQGSAKSAISHLLRILKRIKKGN